MRLEGGSCETPVGTFSFIEVDGAVRAAGFSQLEDLQKRLPDELAYEEIEPSTSDVASRVEKYFGGDVYALDDIFVEQPGSPWKSRAWDELRRIPAGEPISYGELAERVGSPRAARAAGSACATNAVALIVPCHRVTKGGGAPGRYGFGTESKSWLLKHERDHARR